MVFLSFWSLLVLFRRPLLQSVSPAERDAPQSPQSVVKRATDDLFLHIALKGGELRRETKHKGKARNTICGWGKKKLGTKENEHEKGKFKKGNIVPENEHMIRL